MLSTLISSGRRTGCRFRSTACWDSYKVPPALCLSRLAGFHPALVSCQAEPACPGRDRHASRLSSRMATRRLTTYFFHAAGLQHDRGAYGDALPAEPGRQDGKDHAVVSPLHICLQEQTFVIPVAAAVCFPPGSSSGASFPGAGGSATLRISGSTKLSRRDRH
jgi:hypothetical protein